MTSLTIDIIPSSNNNIINFIVWKSSEDSGGVSGFYYDISENKFNVEESPYTNHIRKYYNLKT